MDERPGGSPRRPGPRPRDELAAWSTAPLDPGPLPEIPGLADPSPAGWWETVDGQGIHLRRLTATDTADLPTTWCIHGLAGSSTNWNRLGGALADLTTCVSVDLPGHGWSDPPPGGHYDVRSQARLLARLIDQVESRPVHLIGNSYGGVIATLLAALRPDLVLTLTLISPAVPDLRLVGERGADPRVGLLLLPGTTGLAARQLAAVDPATRARGLAELCFGRPERVDAAALAAAEEEVRTRGALPWVHSSTIGAARALMSSYLRTGQEAFRAVAARVAAPTLIVWGTRDRLVDARLARPTAASFADARLLMIASSGHVAQMEDPEPTARAVRALLRRRSVGTGGDAAPGVPWGTPVRAVAGSQS